MKPGQVLVRLDTATLEAQLAEADGERRRPPQERLAVPEASIVKQKSEIELAEIEVDALAEAGGARAPARSGSSTSARRQLETTKATLAEAEAMLQTAEQEVEVGARRTPRRSRRASTTRR